MSEEKEIYIKVTKDGPYIVYGHPKIMQKNIQADEEGNAIKYGDGKVFEIKSEPVYLCRCGKSKNAPFCDNSHTGCIDFDGTETASFEPILNNAIEYSGEHLTLMDNEEYCAIARFCDVHGSIWNLIFQNTDYSESEVKRETSLCPSGRLMIFDKNGNMLEEELPQMISVLEDDGLKISGPLWLTGKIRVESADGKSYEIRHRQTLCRCGKSENKPFCNGAHKHIKFQANYPE